MKKGWVDFGEVKDKVTMEMVLGHYRISDLKRSGQNLRGKCPLHEGQGERTLSVSLDRDLFFCFSCRAGGNVLVGCSDCKRLV